MRAAQISGVIASEPRQQDGRFLFLFRDDFGQEISCCSTLTFAGEVPKRGRPVTLCGGFPEDLDAKPGRSFIFAFSAIKQ